MHQQDYSSKVSALAMLFECFPASKVTDAMNQTYLEAAQSASKKAVELACGDFRHGRDDRQRKEFLPSTAQFSERVRHHQDQIDRSARTFKAIPKMGDYQTPQARADMSKKMDYLKKHGPEATAKKYGIKV